MFITKMSLPRRTFLRGMGAALALPLLDAMVPALTAAGEDRGAARSAASAPSTCRTARSIELLDADDDRRRTSSSRRS